MDERTTMGLDIQRGGEPAPIKRGKGKYKELADAAREASPEWVSVAGVSSNLAGSIRREQAKGFEPGEHGYFEATNRDTQEDGTVTIWVRYVKNEEGTA
jgi:L-amino acid N-acyltransferase YncA